MFCVYVWTSLSEIKVMYVCMYVKIKIRRTAHLLAQLSATDGQDRKEEEKDKGRKEKDRMSNSPTVRHYSGRFTH